MRIFTAGIATETNTFAPLPTGLAAFREGGYYPAGTHPPHLTLFSGPLWAARQRAAEQGWTVLEGLVTHAQPGGVTTRHAWETLRDELLADLRAALPVQVVLLGLHGAMVADGCDDCEGELLREVRALVGPGAVVGAELDPHHHLSEAMLTCWSASRNTPTPTCWSAPTSCWTCAPPPRPGACAPPWAWPTPA